MIHKPSRRDMIQSLFGGIGTFGLAAVMGSQPAKGFDLGKYTGPRTPAGKRDHYHFEIFALDTVLPADAAAGGFGALVDAMKGHVLASGEVVGIGQAPPS